MSLLVNFLSPSLLVKLTGGIGGYTNDFPMHINSPPRSTILTGGSFISALSMASLLISVKSLESLEFIDKTPSLLSTLPSPSPKSLPRILRHVTWTELDEINRALGPQESIFSSEAWRVLNQIRVPIVFSWWEKKLIFFENSHENFNKVPEIFSLSI